MAWDTDETKRRLLDAAIAEFAAHGLHGTSVEQIARRAGVNKERLYRYFGDKEQMFATVLGLELAKIAAAVPAELLSSSDVGAYAGRVFDYHADHPELVRLLHWEALAYGDGEIPDELLRAAHYRTKVDAFAAAQRDRGVTRAIDADHLVFLILAIADWWVAVPQIARMLTGAPGSDDEERRRRRASVVAAARRIAGP